MKHTRFCVIISSSNMNLMEVHKMKCPKCGIQMEPGEIAGGRGDAWVYWAPKSFLDKHWFNSYCHTKKAVQDEGGIIIKMNNKLRTPAVAYGCRECNLIIVDCN